MRCTIAAPGAQTPGSTKPNQDQPSVYHDALRGFTVRLPVYPQTRSGEGIGIFHFDCSPDPSSPVQVTAWEDSEEAIDRDTVFNLERSDLQGRGATIRAEQEVKVGRRTMLRWEYNLPRDESRRRFLKAIVVRPRRNLAIECAAPESLFEQCRREFDLCLSSYSEEGAPAQAARGSDKRPGHSWYHDRARGFSLELPRPLDGSLERRQTFGYGGPSESPIQPFVSIRAVDLPPPSSESVTDKTSLRERTKRALDAQGARLLADRAVPVGKGEAVRLEYQAGAPGLLTHSAELVVVGPDHEVRVLCTSASDEFSRYRSEFEQCLKSYPAAARK